MKWFRVLAGLLAAINDGSLQLLEYVLAENKILRTQIPSGVKLNDSDRRKLAEVGKKLAKRVLSKIGSIVSPDTILDWYRTLITKEFDGSRRKRGPGRPWKPKLIEELVLRFVRENRSWGYGRNIGALANVGHEVCANTVANIPKKHGIEPVPTRSRGTSWAEFIKSHLSVMNSTDFFTAEVLTLRGFATCYVLSFIELGTRRVLFAGITEHPDEAWMMQVARNVTMADLGFLDGTRHLVHDRDSKYTAAFRETIWSGGVKSVRLPAHSPNLIAFAQRWVRGVNEECVGKMILLAEASLRRAVVQYPTHYHGERNHQGRENALLMPKIEDRIGAADGRLRCRERMGELLKVYHRAA